MGGPRQGTSNFQGLVFFLNPPFRFGSLEAHGQVGLGLNALKALESLSTWRLGGNGGMDDEDHYLGIF